MISSYKGVNRHAFALTVIKDQKILQAVLLESDKHEAFIKTYGQLILGLKLKHQNPLKTSLTPIVDLLLKLVIALSVT